MNMLDNAVVNNATNAVVGRSAQVLSRRSLDQISKPDDVVKHIIAARNIAIDGNADHALLTMLDAALILVGNHLHKSIRR